MIQGRHDHASVSMGNKMFVIGGHKTTSCEVFDSFTRQFTTIKSCLIPKMKSRYFKAVCTGNNIVVLRSLSLLVKQLFICMMFVKTNGQLLIVISLKTCLIQVLLSITLKK